MVLVAGGCAGPNDVSPSSSNGSGSTVVNPTTLPSTTPLPADLSRRPLTWLTAQPYISISGFDGGSTDFFEIFDEGSSWDSAADHVDVYKMYDQLGLARVARDDEWTRVIEGVERRNLALAMELGPLPEGKGCGGGEGFGGDYSVSLVEQVKRLGGQVDVVVFDAPYTFGHFWGGDQPVPCNWSAERIAEESARFVSTLREVEPDIVVGGIEALWDVVEPNDIGIWLDAYEAAAGEPLAFLHLDIDWGRSDWAEATLAVEHLSRERGVPFGIIYNGGEDQVSDETWSDAAADRMYEYEWLTGGRPDHIIFQSWHVFPGRALPDDDPSTLTGLVNRYFSPRTELTTNWGSEPGGLTLTGTTSTESGSPVPGATVSVVALPLDGVPQTLRLNGTVPEDASHAVIAVRINSEGAGPGNADLRLYNVAYGEGTESKHVLTFTEDLRDWGSTGEATVTFEPDDAGAGTALRVLADPNQSLSLDSASTIDVVPGADFEIGVTSAVPLLSRGTGYVAVIFLGSGGEIDRQMLFLEPKPIDLGSLTTSIDGEFVLTAAVSPGRYRTLVKVKGDLNHWPAQIESEVTVPRP